LPRPPFRESKELQDIHGELLALAEHFHRRREPLLLEWQRSIKRDPDLTDGDALPRGELLDHLPALLAAFGRCLRHAAVEKAAEEAAQAPAAAHGLQRWLQGYDLREVTRELGKLNACVILELDRFASANPNFSLDALARARQLWTDLCSAGIEESVNQYFTLQQQEAAGHLKELEQALEQIRELEQQRGDLWRQAAHDLRGNLSVVANVTVGLTRHGSQDSREDFVRILMRNVTSLHHLLDDVTSLARLQAGRETRQIEPLDASLIVQSLCDGIRPMAAERGLFLKCEGPPGFAADGDAVKIRRIGQNLLLNAVKYTRVGGITVSWGAGAPDDPKRWVLCIQDTGPGFHTASGQPLSAALDTQRDPVPSSSATPDGPSQQGPAPVKGLFSVDAIAAQSLRGDSGEGVGLSIVKRLCEMLDATIEMHSVPQVGTTFRILFPRHYN
jgi:signal transduction histidine kinase